jgi:tRNA 2-thiouridine synthesizing protein E
MPTTTLANRTVHVGDDGYLTDPAEWDVALAEALADRIGVTLTDGHWYALRALRDEVRERGAMPTLRRIATRAGMPITELFVLFPREPLAMMAYVAGLPRPRTGALPRPRLGGAPRSGPLL